MAAPAAEQLSLPDLDGATEMSLRETTFVVVDLETTGGRMTGSDGKPADAITEIGAVKVRGGVVLGEFATLVDPQRSIPPQIVQLTGITTAMVCDAPRIAGVLPMFLEFARGAVLVAHNARFDMGFLRAAADQCGIRWARPQTLCTVQLARRVLSREEAPSVRLAALAKLFAVASEPTHRALDDARATVEVLHALIERVGNQGIHSYAELRSYLPNVPPAQRRKRVLAAGLPRRPGVYLFHGPADEVLYIGTAINLRRRVSQYFNGSDQRTRMKEMVALATRVEHVECAHALEAGVRELRLLERPRPALQPPVEIPATLVVAGADARKPSPGSRWSARRATTARSARFDPAPTPSTPPTCWRASPECAPAPSGWPARRCTGRPARNSKSRHAPPPAMSPPAQYGPAAQAAAALIDGLENTALTAAAQRIAELAGRQRYESAARLRDHTVATVEVLWRGQRLRALAALPELVAAAPDGEGGWQLAVVRHGQLAAAGTARRGVPPMPVVDAIGAGAQVILPQPAPLGGALVEETALIARWLAAPGVRIVRTGGEQGWCSPLRSAGPWADWAAAARSARVAAEQAVTSRGSELLTEPHPTREQLFGRTAVDRLDGSRQPVLPRRQPLGAAG